MIKNWLGYLVDPHSKAPLTLSVKTSHGDQVLEGEFLSAEGKSRYPITGGVPRFVPREFYDDSHTPDSDTIQTAKCYGDFWREEANRTLGRSEAELTAYEPRFLAMLGVRDRRELRDLFEDGMNCLNAGCGVAWSEYLFNVNDKVNRFAVDLSLSVDVAYENTKAMKNIFVAQADLFTLPFRYAFFDIIFSGGVLHHTSDAKAAFKALCDHLKPGGLIGIYTYKVKPFMRELADREIRKLTTEMEYKDLHAFSRQLAKLGRSLQKFKDPLIIEEDCPLLGIKRGEYNLQKFLYDHFLKCYYNEELGDEQSLLTNVDWYQPKYASHHTPEEVASWFEENRIEDVRFVNLKGWEHSSLFVSGRKAQ